MTLTLTSKKIYVDINGKNNNKKIDKMISSNIHNVDSWRPYKNTHSCRYNTYDNTILKNRIYSLESNTLFTTLKHKHVCDPLISVPTAGVQR